MNLQDRFNFGQDEGLNLLQVYQGTDRIDKKLLKEFIVEKITYNKGDDRAIRLKYEFGPNTVRITHDLDSVSNDYDFSEMLNEYFKNDIYSARPLAGGLPIDRLNIHLSKTHGTSPLVAGGQPDYVEYLYKIKPEFYINVHAIKRLLELKSCQFLGVIFTKEFDNIYSYEAKVLKYQYKFGETTLKTNDQRTTDNFNKIFDLNYNEVDEVPSYFEKIEYSCACGENPCMCSDPDPG